MILFCEDVLAEEIARRLVSEIHPELSLHATMSGGGFAKLRERAAAIKKSSKGVLFFVLFDADLVPNGCPGAFLFELFGDPKPANIIARFANLEMENWLLADREGIARFFRISPASLPLTDDDTQDAKERLVLAAKKSKHRAIRDALCPAAGTTATVGPEYNSTMSEFVRDHWDFERAAERSRSLRRAIEDLKQRV